MDINEMDIDEIEASGQINLSKIGESSLQRFCKQAATSFFDKYGLISHQLNSYNLFIEHGLQNVFESFGEMLVEPSFDPTKKKENGWRYVTVKFGKVTVEKPTFFSDDKELAFFPWHARLQNMTYSARMKVNVQVEVFIAQEQMCTKRLWISNSPWTVSFRSETKRNRFIVRLAENQKSEDYRRKEKVLTVYFLSTEIPVWLLFFALGVSSDKEAMGLIACDGDDASITNSLIASVHEADAVCEGFRHGNRALAYVEEQIKSTKLPPDESVDDCLHLYLFPGLQGLKKKARFLGYMVKSLLSAYSGKRKCENRDSFRNKRIEL